MVLNLHIKWVYVFLQLSIFLSEKNRENTPLYTPHPIVVVGFPMAIGAKHPISKLARDKSNGQAIQRITNRDPGAACGFFPFQ